MTYAPKVPGNIINFSDLGVDKRFEPLARPNIKPGIVERYEENYRFS